MSMNTKSINISRVSHPALKHTKTVDPWGGAYVYVYIYTYIYIYVFWNKALGLAGMANASLPAEDCHDYRIRV